MSSSRKRRCTGRPLVSRRSTKTSRVASANRLAPGMADDDSTPTETINVMDSVEEVVDLTCEASEAAVVDLTHNDSVLLVSSDEDNDTSDVIRTAVMSSDHVSRSTPGTISCPVCLDSYSEIVKNGRLVVSTKCGHVFCSQCLRDTVKSLHSCPTCRKRLTNRQYHPLYI